MGIGDAGMLQGKALIQSSYACSSESDILLGFKYNLNPFVAL